MKIVEYKCQCCKQTFKYVDNGYIEQENKLEYQRNFPDCDFDTDCVTVCNDCYKKVERYYNGFGKTIKEGFGK